MNHSGGLDSPVLWVAVCCHELPLTQDSFSDLGPPGICILRAFLCPHTPSVQGTVLGTKGHKGQASFMELLFQKDRHEQGTKKPRVTDVSEAQKCAVRKGE